MKGNARYYTYDIKIKWKGIAVEGGQDNVKYQYEGYVIIPEKDTRETVSYYKYDGKQLTKQKIISKRPHGLNFMWSLLFATN